MQWSDPPTLRALDSRGGQWSQLPPSFLKAAERVLGPNREAAEEAVNLSLAALTAAVDVLVDLLPQMSLAAFGDAVRTMRRDRDLRALFKAGYATRTAGKNPNEYPGAPTVLTDPFCLETSPSRYWFEAETCEKLVCAFITRQTLNRRRRLLDIHESGVAYSLRGTYQSDDLPSERLTFHTWEDVSVDSEPGRYYIRPLYEFQRSVRHLVGAEVVIQSPRPKVLDVDLSTGQLFDCFNSRRFAPSGGQTNDPPFLVEIPTRVEHVTSEHLAALPHRQETPKAAAILDEYTFILVKRVTPDANRQVALNRAITWYFRSDVGAHLSGWAGIYRRWIHHTIGEDGLLDSPEDKNQRADALADLEAEGQRLWVYLAMWIQGQVYLPNLPTQVRCYIQANVPASLRDLAPRSHAKVTWREWARRLRPHQAIQPKQMVDAWATVWKLLEVALQYHQDEDRSRISFSEFADAMPVKVYPVNYEGEFALLRSRVSE